MHISLVVFVIVPYLIIIIFFIIGWFKIPLLKNFQNSDQPFVSIIIPVKNEKSNINKLVEDIINQSYPKLKFEALFIDDHSEDESYGLIKNFASKYDFIKLISLPHGISGKKKALLFGIESAKGEFIITSDGDCSYSLKWIESMVRYYLAYPFHLIIGPVILKTKKGFFNAFQELEFLSLIASGAGAAGINKPILCNGANLGANRSLFLKCIDVYHSSVASGDDIFLLLELKKHKVPAIFVKSNDATVETNQTSNLDSFLNQRSRWTFKSRYYKDLDIVSVALIVLLTNLFLVTGLFYSLFHSQFIYDFLLLYILKCIVDYVLLYYVAAFFKRKYLLRYFLIHQLFYIFYVSFIGIGSHFTQNKWANRKV